MFMIKGKDIQTHPDSDQILGGITKDVVRELVEADEEYNFIAKEFTCSELLQADEVWISSSTKNIAPIIKIDETQIGDGQAGPVWNRFYRKFLDFIESH